jgi:hypothetical protein
MADADGVFSHLANNTKNRMRLSSRLGEHLVSRWLLELRLGVRGSCDSFEVFRWFASNTKGSNVICGHESPLPVQ